MHDLLATIQHIVREELRQMRLAELAVVQEIHAHADGGDTDNYACSVMLRDSGLVLKKVPVATARAGLASIPGVDDLVLVQFIGGDLNAPIITGTFYNEKDRPPVNAAGQYILHLPLAGGESDAVHLEIASQDKQELTLKLGSGVEIAIKNDDPAVKISVDGGKATVQIDKDGQTAVESQGKLSLKANEIIIEAQGQLTLKGATVNIN